MKLSRKFKLNNNLYCLSDIIQILSDYAPRISNIVMESLDEDLTYTDRRWLLKEELNLPFDIYTGSSRMCVYLNEKYVLKLAHCERGIHQNATEIGIYTSVSTYHKRFLGKIFSACPDNQWLIMERLIVIDGFLPDKHLSNALDFFRDTFDLVSADLDQLGRRSEQTPVKLFDYGFTCEIRNKFY